MFVCSIENVIVTAVLSAAIVSLTGAAPVFAQASIKGSIESFEGPSRLSRPGTALPGAAKSAKPDTKGLSLKGGTTGSVLSMDNFKLGKSSVPTNLLSPPGSKNGAAAKDADEGSHELTVAWDEWHKRVISALYQRWKDTHSVAGQAKVTIVVSREGDMEMEIHDFEEPDFSDAESENPEEAFKQAIKSTIHGLLHSSILDFPSLSQRKTVKLVTTFSMNMLGPSGYTYKQGDYERIRAGK
ncbi:MAG: hypothetical protein K2W95_01240 [Candidatus Obscuribacterales bacterium]|nr:hypothetical protein [Candidatus Obscuribacterales bacterium]